MSTIKQCHVVVLTANNKTNNQCGEEKGWGLTLCYIITTVNSDFDYKSSSL